MTWEFMDNRVVNSRATPTKPAAALPATSTNVVKVIKIRANKVKVWITVLTHHKMIS